MLIHSKFGNVVNCFIAKIIQAMRSGDRARWVVWTEVGRVVAARAFPLLFAAMGRALRKELPKDSFASEECLFGLN
jgi:hypothetical protein